MAENSKIEWCDHTFNPWIGCTKVGPGCDHCYAESLMDTRLHQVSWGASRKRTSDAYWQLPLKWNRQAQEQGVRYRVFCASLADVFDNEVPWTWRSNLFTVIETTPHLDWLLLTKRIGNVQGMIDEIMVPYLPDNVWLGATIVNQEEADRDIQKLLAVPATVHFLSMEPLLGSVSIEPYLNPDYTGELTQGSCTEHPAIDWVIVGGESGGKARPMQADWVRSIRDQCKDSGTPFLFKQWGEYAPNWYNDDDGNMIAGSEWMDKFGKKKAGRTLDGLTHDGFPA